QVFSTSRVACSLRVEKASPFSTLLNLQLNIGSGASELAPGKAEASEKAQCAEAHEHFEDDSNAAWPTRSRPWPMFRTSAAGPANARPRRKESGWWRSAPLGTAASRGTCAPHRIRWRSRSRR